jgi:hypothetical protein
MTSNVPFNNVPHSNNNLSALQKKFGMPKQVRQLERFFPDKIAYSGKDPKGGYSDFIKNDIFKPLNRNLNDLPKFVKPYEKYDPNKVCKNDIVNYDKWALNTNKICPSPDLIPKNQQLKDIYFPSMNKNPEKVEMYKNTYLKSDHISIRYPNLEKNKEVNTSIQDKNGYFPQNNNSIDDISSLLTPKSRNYDVINYNSNNLYSPNLNNYKDNKIGLILNFKSIYL